MPTPYDIDFNCWALEQAAALKADHWQQLDWEHLAKKIEALYSSLNSCLRCVIVSWREVFQRCGLKVHERLR